MAKQATARWTTYTRGTIPPYRLEIALRGVQFFGTAYNGTRADRVLHTTQGKNLTWGWDERQLYSVGKKVIQTCSTKTGAIHHFRDIEKVIDRANSASEKFRSLDLRRLSNQGLIEIQRWLFQETGPAHGFLDIDIDAVDAVFEKYLYDTIRREVPEKLSEEKFAALFKTLSAPIHQTYVAEEELAIERALKSGLCAADVNKIYKRFWWTELGWEQVRSIDEHVYLGKILNYLRNRPTKKRLSQLTSLTQKLAKDRIIILKTYRFSATVGHWLDVLDRYAYYHDRRKEMQCRSMYAFHLWLREAARRLKVSTNDLEWFYSHEIGRFLHGRTFDKKELTRRKKSVLVLADKKRLQIFSGQRALLKRRALLGSNAHSATAVKGVGVTSGVVRARARVCNGVVEARRKVKSGDILICGMTLPDYVPVMKRAAAIVTDEGGITCHAAIVARELHKPCVVGTRLATKVFKDGDWVEVDAIKGIVRKL